MVATNIPKALKQYQQVSTQSGVAYASPHRLIQMLMEGAFERIATAKGCIQRHDIPGKGEQIGKAIDIIGGLRDALNMEAGGELAANLDDLYDFMQRRLLEANLHSDIASSTKSPTCCARSRKVGTPLAIARKQFHLRRQWTRRRDDAH